MVIAWEDAQRLYCRLDIGILIVSVRRVNWTKTEAFKERMVAIQTMLLA